MATLSRFITNQRFSRPNFDKELTTNYNTGNCVKILHPVHTQPVTQTNNDDKLRVRDKSIRNFDWIKVLVELTG